METLFSIAVLDPKAVLGTKAGTGVFYKKAVPENFAIFTGKHLCWSLFLIKRLYEKETPTPVFSCEYVEIFKKTYFEEHLRIEASVGLSLC